MFYLQHEAERVKMWTTITIGAFGTECNATRVQLLEQHGSCAKRPWKKFPAQSV